MQLMAAGMQCNTCDIATHMGRSMSHGFGDDAIRQLCKVNGITPKEARDLYAEALAAWRARNARVWRVAVLKSLLERYPKLAILEQQASSEK